jgi:hypothetical protein
VHHRLCSQVLAGSRGLCCSAYGLVHGIPSRSLPVAHWRVLDNKADTRLHDRTDGLHCHVASMSFSFWPHLHAHGASIGQSALVQAHGEVVRRSVRLAAAAMLWPDFHTQIRAIAVCRTVAAAAGAPLNPVAPPPAAGLCANANLQALLVPCLLHEALRALSIADEGHAISELMLLIRSIYIACASMHPSPVEKLQEMLPNVRVHNLAEVWGQAWLRLSLLRCLRCLHRTGACLRFFVLD